MSIQDMQTVLFLDGKCGKFHIYHWMGACLVGDPTAYCYRNGQFTWLVPGESVQWMEV